MLRKPLLPGQYFLWFDPPDETGDETLHVVSEARSLTLKGRAFREFTTVVAPLLDGRRTLAEIQDAARAVFEPQDVAACIELLEAQGVVVDGDAGAPPDEAAARMAPQLNFFHDVVPGTHPQARLARATVAVLGLGGAGATASWALSQAGVGTVRCVDPSPVGAADPYWSPVFDLETVGERRADAAARALRAAAPQVDARADEGGLESEADVRRAVAGADYVLCCLDPSQANVIYKLNRVCLETGTRWCVCTLAGTEIVAGPAVHPGTGPCYLCYRMRAIACASNPETAFGHEQFLDRRKRDDGARRGNLVFGAGLAGQLIALEAFKTLTGLAEPSLVGRIMTIRLTDLVAEHHVVLRKPWCPACSGRPAGSEP